MNIQGKIVEIFDSAQVSDKFRKREFVVEYAENPQYPEFVKLELVQDKCELIDSFREGDEVSVEFNLRGRAWTNREGGKSYFNTLQAWRIQPLSQAQSAAPAPSNAGSRPQAQPAASNAARPASQDTKASAPLESFADDSDNELPF